jgi:uncharacterized protein (TIRG00374 family)
MGRVLKVALGVIVTIAILALVVHITGVEETAEAIGQAGIWAFAAIGGTQLLFLLLHAVAIRVLCKPIGHRISLWRMLKATTTGMAANIITPSTYLGGEPIKVIYLGRKTGLSYQELAGTVLLAKYMEALSFVFLLGICVGATLVVFGDHLFSSANIAIGIALILVAAGAIVLSMTILGALRHDRRPLTAVVEFLSRPRWSRRFFARLRKRTRVMEGQVSRVFREEGPAIKSSLLMYVLSHGVLFVRPLVFFGLGWGMELDFELLSLIFIMSQVLLALQITPSAVGTLDGGLIGVLALVQADTIISAPQCAAYLLALRFWDAIVVGAGVMLSAKVGLKLLLGSKERSSQK